jgi:hypothetical protein
MQTRTIPRTRKLNKVRNEMMSDSGISYLLLGEFADSSEKKRSKDKLSNKNRFKHFIFPLFVFIYIDIIQHQYH